MKTLKQISQIFKDFVEQHSQLNSYFIDSIDNATTQDITYPMLWAMPTDTQLFKLSFDIYIADLLETDRTNLLDALSSMNDIVYDFNEYLLTNNYLDIDEDNISITPFLGKFDDHALGWIMNISIDYINPKDC